MFLLSSLSTYSFDFLKASLSLTSNSCSETYLNHQIKTFFNIYIIFCAFFAGLLHLIIQSHHRVSHIRRRKAVAGERGRGVRFIKAFNKIFSISNFYNISHPFNFPYLLSSFPSFLSSRQYYSHCDPLSSLRIHMWILACDADSL